MLSLYLRRFRWYRRLVGGCWVKLNDPLMVTQGTWVPVDPWADTATFKKMGVLFDSFEDHNA